MFDTNQDRLKEEQERANAREVNESIDREHEAVMQEGVEAIEVNLPQIDQDQSAEQIRGQNASFYTVDEAAFTIADEINLNEEHAAMVARLAKPGADILAQLDAAKCDLWHMASCVPGEAGELFDAVKKFVIYGKGAIDIENVVEELGDLEFYMAGVRKALGITRERTLQANIAKLEGKNGRYKEGYSDAAALNRADKQPEVDPVTTAENNSASLGAPI